MHAWACMASLQGLVWPGEGGEAVAVFAFQQSNWVAPKQSAHNDRAVLLDRLLLEARVLTPSPALFCRPPPSHKAGMAPHPLQTAAPHTSTSSRTSSPLQHTQQGEQRAATRQEQQQQQPQQEQQATAARQVGVAATRCLRCSSPPQACCLMGTLRLPRHTQQTRAAGCWSTCRVQMSLRHTGSTGTRGATSWCATCCGRALWSGR